MLVDVKDVGVMLVRACRDQDVRDGHAVSAFRPEFALRSARDRDGLGVHAQLVQFGELGFEPLEFVW